MRLLNIRCISLAILFAFLSTGLSGVFLNRANASSVYDDAYQTSSDLTVWTEYEDGVKSCNTDVSSDWSQYIIQGAFNPANSYSDGGIYSYYGNFANPSWGVSLNNAIQGSGQWGVSSVHYDGDGSFGTWGGNSVRIYWTEDNSLSLDWSVSSVSAYSSSNSMYYVYLSCFDYTDYPSPGAYEYCNENNPCIRIEGPRKYPYELNNGRVEVSNSTGDYNNYLFTGSKDYPANYDGLSVEDGLMTDEDSDGLNVIREIQQGTSDNNPDSDGDGINDLKESIWYVDRDDVFCDTGVTPHVCAYPDPTVKDIYVEIDWMNDGTESYKPTNNQIGLVESGLSELRYNVYIDNGQYGGGNEVSEYIDDLSFTPDPLSVDFFDLKNGNSSESISENFSTERQGIWRYLLSGYKYSEKPTSSGASFSGSDNTFISYGLIKDNPTSFGYSNFDTAIAGTIVHELGHSLCLSNSQEYSYQSSSCIHSGIDTSASLNYDSVMNYNLQMFQNNLSNGNNGPGDHDDWGAIDNNGIADFADWDISEASSGSSYKLFKGLTIEDAVELHNEDKLGKVKKDNRLYDLRFNKVTDLKTGKISQL